MYEYRLRVRGRDLTNIALAMQVRLYGDAPGAPLIDLVTVTDPAVEGLRLASVTFEAGVPISEVRIRIGKPARQALPYMGEAGQPARFAHTLLIGGVTRIVGEVIVPAHAYGSDAAPTSRPASGAAVVAAAFEVTSGATLTIVADEVTEIVLDGAGDLGALVAESQTQAQAAASSALEAATNRAQAAAAAAGAADTVYELGRGVGPKNFYVRENVTADRAIIANGLIANGANQTLSDLMRVKPGGQYSVSLVCAYRSLDAAGVYVPGSYGNAVAGGSIVMPAAGRFLQISHQTTGANRVMVTAGALPSAYLDAGFDDRASAKRLRTSSAMRVVTGLLPSGINLFDRSRAKADTSISAVNGALSVTANYTLSDAGTSVLEDAIVVRAGRSYVMNAATAVVFYDEDGKYLTSAMATAGQAFVAPDGASYLRFHMNPSSVRDTLMVVAGTVLPTAYVAFGYPTSKVVTLSGDTLMVSVPGVWSENEWVDVPDGVYFVRWQQSPVASIYATTVRQGRAAIVSGAQFTASVSGTVLTVSGFVAGGLIRVGDVVYGAGLDGLQIVSTGTGTGGNGTYNLASAPAADVANVATRSMPSGAVASKPFGGVSAGTRPGVRIGFLGDSQTANLLYQAQVLAVTGGVQVFSSGNPGFDVNGLLGVLPGLNLAAIDVLYVQHGHNDWAGTRALGDPSDAAGTDTICGKLKALIDAAYAKNPSLVIVLGGPTYRGPGTIAGITYTADTTPRNGRTGVQINDAMRAIATEYGIPFAELRRRSNINPLTVATRTSDSLHWNALSGATVGRLVGAKINAAC